MERRFVGRNCLCRFLAVRDETVEAQLSGLGKNLYRVQICLSPLCGDANACLAHERGRKAEDRGCS